MIARPPSRQLMITWPKKRKERGERGKEDGRAKVQRVERSDAEDTLTCQLNFYLLFVGKRGGEKGKKGGG